MTKKKHIYATSNLDAYRKGEIKKAHTFCGDWKKPLLNDDSDPLTPTCLECVRLYGKYVRGVDLQPYQKPAPAANFYTYTVTFNPKKKKESS